MVQLIGCLLMKPTLEEYQKSSAVWVDTYREVRYRINHHGISEYNHEGIWCYYIYLNEDQMLPEDFEKFNLDREFYELADKKRECYRYYGLDLDMYGGITWYKKETHWSPYTSKDITIIEVGCDFNHTWDRDNYYWHGFKDIEWEVKKTIDIFLERYKIRKSCKYCGMYGEDDEFYLNKNGGNVLKRMVPKIPVGWEGYQPADSESDEFKEWFKENVGTEDLN